MRPTLQLQAARAGKQRIAYPTIKRILKLIDIPCAMILQDHLSSCHGVLQFRRPGYTETVAFTRVPCGESCWPRDSMPSALGEEVRRWPAVRCRRACARRDAGHQTGATSGIEHATTQPLQQAPRRSETAY